VEAGSQGHSRGVIKRKPPRLKKTFERGGGKVTSSDLASRFLSSMARAFRPSPCGLVAAFHGAVIVADQKKNPTEGRAFRGGTFLGVLFLVSTPTWVRTLAHELKGNACQACGQGRGSAT